MPVLTRPFGNRHVGALPVPQGKLLLVVPGLRPGDRGSSGFLSALLLLPFCVPIIAKKARKVKISVNARTWVHSPGRQKGNFLLISGRWQPGKRRLQSDQRRL